MLSKKRLTTVISTIFVLIVLLLSTFSMYIVQADPVTGKTTFYFVDMFDETQPRSSLDVPLMSTLPSTNSTDLFYPPKIFDGDTEQLTMWFYMWALSLFENLEEFGDIPGDISDLLDGYMILLPNPLRIVQAYDYMGNETVNISGDVSFNIFTRSKLSSKINKNDNLKVSLYAMDENSFFPVEITNKTINIPSKYQEKISPMTILLKDVNYKLRPGTSLLFAVELIPGEKHLTKMIFDNDSILRTLIDPFTTLITSFINNSGNEDLELILELLDLLNEMSGEFNITTDQIAVVIDSLISTSLVYGSQSHPSSVSVPFIAGNTDREDFLTYYLHSDKTMDITSPASSEHSTVSLTSGAASWSGPVLTRNKLISDVSAFLYIEHSDYRLIKTPISVEVTLLSNGQELAKSTQTLSKTKLFESSLLAYQFTFDTIINQIELDYGTKLGLRISLSSSTNGSSLLGPSVSLYYDSLQYLSFISFRISETDHIAVKGVSEPFNGKIIPGGIVTYTLNVTSELSDNITVSVRDSTFSSDEKEQWKIDIVPTSFTVNANGEKTVTVKATSLDRTLEAYTKGPLRAIVDIIGLTGITSFSLYAEVHPDAVTYDFIVRNPHEKEIVHGTSVVYTFEVINNNSGIYPDGYIFTATSENFNVTISPLTVNDVAFQETIFVNVTMNVSKNTDVRDDTLTLTVKSKGKGLEKIGMVNSTIIGATVFENIYDYFDSLAGNIGLKDAFGSYGAYLLIAILLMVLFFIILLMVLLLTTRFAEIICTDRVKEILPTEQAIFEVTIRNPTKKTRSYLLDIELSENEGKWKATMDRNNLEIPPRQSRNVVVIVSSSDVIDADDWTQVTMYVTPEGRRSCYSLDLLTSVKDGSEDLLIDNVYHWPRRFIPSQKVQTSFKLRNKGYIQAKNVKVSLYINGEQKNKVEDVVIPAGGYADITLPWIAGKGKQELHLVVS
ncbi:MAG: CARDB domain-containing protein [Candidatus Thermoplasmatota archaeon]|nr:CARDB domain-containing protein [Candidatus Thermoplasmatota archaeon]